MGQSTSRNPTPSDSPSSSSQSQLQSPTSASSSSSPQRVIPESPRTPSSTNKRSRPSSLRRSVLGLIPSARSSSSLRSDSSTPEDSKQPARKRWRSSRRWSKARTHIPDESSQDSALHSTSASVPVIAEDISREEVPSRIATRDGTQSVPSRSPTSLPVDLPAEPDLDLLSEEEHRLSHNIGSWLSGGGLPSQSTQPSRNDILAAIRDVEREIDQNMSESTTSNPEPPLADDSEGPSAPLQTESSVNATTPDQATESPPQAMHQFPPPGTLVVVQGVVNTSDNSPQAPMARSAPRPASVVSLPAPQTTPLQRSGSISRSNNSTDDRQSTRSRLSAFIPRSSGRRSSSETTRDTDLSGSGDLPSGSSPAEEIRSVSTEIQDSRPEDDTRPRPLSPGSIDVLGTLLSVAAAATAASLFSPGLGFAAGANADTQPVPGIPRPMSPTPTSGLGSLGGLGSLPGFGLDPTGGQAQSQREGRDRIRNVWESVRDRLGLSARNPSLNGAQPDGSSAVGGETRMRPGEMMLAEMARALNIGLGLNSDGGSGGARPVPTHQPAAGGEGAGVVDGNSPSPPEDSFEQFLINLQADLRAALTADGLEGDDTSDSQLPANQPSSEVLQSPPTGEDNPPLQNDNDDEPPPLADLSDSDEDDDEEDEDNVDHYAEHPPRTPTPIPTINEIPFASEQRASPRGIAAQPAEHAERRPPGINLWRLYRFQPIVASQTQTHAASTSSGTSAATEIHASPSTPLAPHLPSSSTTPSPSEGAGSTTSATVDANANANMVVPVIVVGLQSVDMGRALEQEPGDADIPLSPDDTRTAYPAEGTTASDGGPGPAGARGRTWQSRAANALRTLRPGLRRGGSRGRGVSDAGSRTFLIYVIGGYYPPNHHMVTGADSLDSYEALWELAELLGQVKPPVATKEDIDNSGLQVIKPTDLQTYEQDGRVASNCVDRCLICLDDYESDDELRLMSCKHAFHKDCVDKWLQVGRNNCPACRTQLTFLQYIRLVTALKLSSSTWSKKQRNSAISTIWYHTAIGSYCLVDSAVLRDNDAQCHPDFMYRGMRDLSLAAVERIFENANISVELESHAAGTTVLQNATAIPPSLAVVADGRNRSLSEIRHFVGGGFFPITSDKYEICVVGELHRCHFFIRTTWLPPGPDPHYYVFFVFKQPAGFTNQIFLDGATPITNFNLSQFVQDVGLGDPIGGTFIIRYD
ncbi:hypothetical protein A0H81_08618 [Grifola frondosa]|uniref:RING-type domain-containing protein n=1 Tax=Grifola frondosa TaxID=5627 RepID=A0A1C7M3X3_GRIFR|nr:hypothetical protein A0H81_08618 [Grifola frondosa]